ncbi:MAG: RNA-directed DNA polymerase [Eubacterium sp.]
MKRYCKEISITSTEFILDAIEDWRSHRTAKGMRRSDIQRLYRHFQHDEEKIAEELSEEIKNHCLRIAPVRIKQKVDHSNGKLRTLSVESAKQQILDYVCVHGLRPLMKRIGEYQCTCIPGRGPVWGKRQIERWVRESDVNFVCQVDICKNYQSIKPDMMMSFLRKHIKNDDLLWLIEELLRRNPAGGLPIGSALSVYLDALYLSQAYHYVMEQIPAVKHALFFVDDVAMYCETAEDAYAAGNLLRQYMERIGLHLHEGYTVVKATEKQYQDMLGYRIYKGHSTMRRRDYIKLKSALRRMEKSPDLKNARQLISMNGFIKFSDSYRFRTKYHTKTIMRKARRYVSKYEKSNFQHRAGPGEDLRYERKNNGADLPERIPGRHV